MLIKSDVLVYVSDQGGCVFVYKPTAGFVVLRYSVS